MLGCNIAYIANRYFGSNYVLTVSNMLQKVIQIVL